jgi:hypothetical protein
MGAGTDGSARATGRKPGLYRYRPGVHIGLQTRANLRLAVPGSGPGDSAAGRDGTLYATGRSSVR